MDVNRRQGIARIADSFRRLAIAICSIAIAIPLFAHAQTFPSKPIRLIVGFPPGGVMDIYARSLANQLQERLKNPVVVENRAGAGGLVGADAVIKSAPDGYTLTHIVPSTVTTVFMPDVPFDVFKALQPISSVWAAPFVLTVNTQVPSNSIREFVDHAKAFPGKLNFGSSNGPNYLPMVLFNHLAGIKLESIEYKGAQVMNTALFTNEIQATINTYQSVLPFMKSGKLRVLAVTGSERFPVLPDVPTMTEAGYAGMDDLQSVGGIFAPAGVPASVAAVLQAAFRSIVASPETERLVRDSGRPLLVSNDEFINILRKEVAAWERAAKVSGTSARR